MILEEFPETLAEFTDKFGSDEACREYLIQQRWPDGFKCPRCGHDKATHLKKYDRWTCRKCLHQTTLTAETALRGTHKALKTWFLGMYLVTTSKGGISAFELKRQLGLGSYQTAWTWLKKLRAAMVDPARKPLEGEVEVDESYVGGKEKGVRGRLTKKKAIVACAVENTEKGFGRIRLQIIADVTQAMHRAARSPGGGPGLRTVRDPGRQGAGLLPRVPGCARPSGAAPPRRPQAPLPAAASPAGHPAQKPGWPPKSGLKPPGPSRGSGSGAASPRS